MALPTTEVQAPVQAQAQPLATISATQINSSIRWEMNWPDGDHEIRKAIMKINKSNEGFGFHVTDDKSVRRYVAAHESLVNSGILTKVGMAGDGTDLYGWTALKVRAQDGALYPVN